MSAKIKEGCMPKDAILTLINNDKHAEPKAPIGVQAKVIVSNNIDGKEWVTVKWLDPTATQGLEFGRHRLEEFSTEGIEPAIVLVCSNCGERLKQDVTEEIVEAFNNDITGLNVLKMVLPILKKSKWLLSSDKVSNFGCAGIGLQFKCNKCATKVKSKTI